MWNYSMPGLVNGEEYDGSVVSYDAEVRGLCVRHMSKNRIHSGEIYRIIAITYGRITVWNR